MDMAAVVDDLLEITVIGSFSRIGYGVRRRLFGWTTPRAGSMVGRTVLLTGVTSGLGREAAGTLATLGARVILAGRDEAKLHDGSRRARAHPRRGPVPHPRRRHGVPRLGSRGRRADPRQRVSTRRGHRQRGRHLPDPPGHRRRDRGDAGDDGRRAVRPGRRPAAAARGDRRRPRHLGDLGRAVRRAPPPRRPAVDRRAVERDARVRACEAGAGQHHPRMGAAHRAQRHHFRRDAPGLGGHARHRGRAAGLPPRDGSAAAYAGAGRRHDGLAGRRPTRQPTSRAGSCWTVAPARSTGIPSTRVSPAERRRLWDAVVRLAGIADPRPAPTSIGEA